MKEKGKLNSAMQGDSKNSITNKKDNNTKVAIQKKEKEKNNNVNKIDRQCSKRIMKQHLKH